MTPKRLLLLTVLLLTLLSSCAPSADTILIPEEQPQTPELYDVSLTFSSADFTITCQEIDTRAASTEIPEALNRLTCSVFDAQGEKVATLSQKREALDDGETFGSLSFLLPGGTYKFVAVLHELPEDKLSYEPATITSPTVATLPSNSIQDTYCCVKSQEVSANTSITLDLGTRINAKFQIETLDEVPAGVTSIAIYVNTSSSTVLPTQPTINPTTGLATTSWKYVKNLTATSGQKFNRTFSILLSEDPASVGVKLAPQPTSATYPSRILSEVNFQRNHKTHAKGNLFQPATAASFTIDTSLAEDIDYNF